MIIFCADSLAADQQAHVTNHLKAEISTAVPLADFYLDFSIATSRLCLKKNNSNEHGIFVDFESDEAKYRQQKISAKKDLLARAVGVESGLKVCDLTTGLAGDAFKLCYFGAKVMGFEKNPLVWALVQNALWRHPKALPLHVDNEDSVPCLGKILPSADVFYLDPMFALERTALPRKGMQYLDQITEPTPLADLELTLKTFKDAKKKLIVKRALQNDWLCGAKPSRSLEGKMVRFDIYGN